MFRITKLLRAGMLLMGLVVALGLSIPTGAYAYEEFVTAVRNSRGNLQVILYRIEGPRDGMRIERITSKQRGAISNVSASGLGVGRFVTAVRNAESKLQVIVWGVQGPGRRELVALGDAVGDSVYLRVDATTIRGAGTERDMSSRFATAGVDGSGNLQVIVWDVDHSGRVIQRGSERGQAGRAKDVDVIALSSNMLATAIKTGSGNVKVISWRVDASGNLQRLHDYTGGVLGADVPISTCSVPDQRRGFSRFAVNIATGSGNLKAIIFDVDKERGTVDRQGSSRGAGRASLISAEYLPQGLLTAIRTREEKLKLIKWSVDRSGNNVSRLGDKVSEGADRIATTRLAAAGSLITAIRDNHGNLKVLVWDERNLRVQYETSAGAISAVDVVSTGH